MSSVLAENEPDAKNNLAAVSYAVQISSHLVTVPYYEGRMAVVGRSRCESNGRPVVHPV